VARRTSRSTRVVWGPSAALVLAVAIVLTACSSTTAATRRTTTTTRPSTTTTTAPPPSTTTTTPEQPGWTTIASTARGVAVDERTVVAADGSRVVLARFFSGNVSFSLHVGSSDPPANLAALGPDAGPSVTGAQASRLLACFNGGFMISAGVGGFQVAGQVLYPLQNGQGSFVIDSFGAATVGAWNTAEVPYLGEQTVSARQNLQPLIQGGAPTSSVGNVAAWGATISGIANPARSGAGMDAQGNIIYAGSEAALPADIANALISAGAIQGMQLDINPAWVMLSTAGTPGGALTAQIPGQNPPANACQAGWSRDFIAVLAN
jgi:hypothetical protein